ncbi:protein phosphatase 2C domain-containing protein [Lentzea sp. BCCO 10_0798]|uniref:Protein phosphatase 2C domain-containing protein n=1 Tax=Lentzea kristufekii TaxID=3095430 RepID=A0ABU4TNK4_9PSEU|nr:protein phosphatase 2C domain-containing protein [Lentzea sp. BCCO 10_0798]MDX8049634.1 protein phosphatase 2C domain-containing protein [Lentzea sp. BCCO 10_0798]
MSPGRHAAGPEAATEEEPVEWEEGARPCAVGDPGRAASTVVTEWDARFLFRNDFLVDGVRLPAVESPVADLRAACVRGLKNRYYGKVCQDEYGFLVSPDRRWLVIAVADGVAQGTHSHIAAQIVVRSGCRALSALLGQDDPSRIDWTALLHRLADEVVRYAQAELGLGDRVDVAGTLATTALFAVVGLTPDEDGFLPAYVMPFGDSSAWVLRPDDERPWIALQPVKNEGSVIASSATDAIPLVPHELPAAVKTSIAPGEALVLMTDGVGDALGAGSGEVGQFLAASWREPPEALTFASQANFARRTYDDDRTVVAVWPVRRS